MSMLALVLVCLIVGGMIGFAGGVLGIGGGLIAIPLLGLMLGMGQQMAQGTALVMVVPAVLITLYKYNQHRKLDLNAAMIGGVASFSFTWVGAQLALSLESSLLRKIYALFVLIIAVFYIYESIKMQNYYKSNAYKPMATDLPVNRWWFVFVGMLAGFGGGVFGVGGSVLVVPLLTKVFKYSQSTAQGLGLSMVLPSTLAALFTYSMHGQANWAVGIPLALGSIVCVPYGVKLAYSLPEQRLKMVFGVMLLIIMLLLLLKA